VAYFQEVAKASDRVRYRDQGKTTNGNPFVVLEIASASTLKDLDRHKKLARRLYFQDGVPTDAERAELQRDGKVVLLITTNIHSTEIGASQMVLELVHELATSDEPRVKKRPRSCAPSSAPSTRPGSRKYRSSSRARRRADRETSRFRWSRVSRNREWRTLAALPLAFALLWARGSYLP